MVRCAHGRLVFLVTTTTPLVTSIIFSKILLSKILESCVGANLAALATVGVGVWAKTVSTAIVDSTGWQVRICPPERRPDLSPVMKTLVSLTSKGTMSSRCVSAESVINTMIADLRVGCATWVAWQFTPVIH